MARGSLARAALLAQGFAALAAGAGCKCIGITNMPGNVTAKIKNQQAVYPASIGASCMAWDKDVHPDCKVGSPPAWCANQWCYIDLCTCDGNDPAKATYFEGANFQGVPIYYSYASCGATDTYSDAASKQAKDSDKKKCGVTCEKASGGGGGGGGSGGNSSSAAGGHAWLAPGALVAAAVTHLARSA